MKKSELQDWLERFGLRPNARFGQNFLVDPALVSRIPQDAGVEAGQAVLEVGPGAGALTLELLQRGAQVCAVEIDHGLHGLLQERFAESIEAGRLHLIRGDVLGPKEGWHPEVDAWWSAQQAAPAVVANLPYAISGPFLARLAARPLASATLLLQREVAEKAAGPGSGEEWSPLAVRLSLAFETRLGRRLPPEVFWPRPKIDSAFLHLLPRADRLSAAEDGELREVLRLAFSQRRKRLLGRLRKEREDWAVALEAAGVEPGQRPGEVPPAIWREALHRLS